MRPIHVRRQGVVSGKNQSSTADDMHCRRFDLVMSRRSLRHDSLDVQEPCRQFVVPIELIIILDFLASWYVNNL